MRSNALIFKNLRHINNLYRRILTKELSSVQLGHHFEVLLTLAAQDKPVNQNKLAELLQIDKSRMANLVYDLEKKGLVYTQINPKDRREHLLFLSEAAINSIHAIEQAIEKTNEFAETGISPEKLLTFLEVSEQIEFNLRNRMAS